MDQETSLSGSPRVSIEFISGFILFYYYFWLQCRCNVVPRLYIWSTHKAPIHTVFKIAQTRVCAIYRSPLGLIRSDLFICPSHRSGIVFRHSEGLAKFFVHNCSLGHIRLSLHRYLNAIYYMFGG